MNLEPGLVVSIRHYSMLNVFKGTVLDIQDNVVTIKLPKECLRTSFLKGDPLVVAHEIYGAVDIIGGRIIDFNTGGEWLTFTEDILDPDESGNRSYERFPVSLYADYRLIDGIGSKKCFALVKDISEYGMMIYARDSFFKGQKLNLDVFLTRDILSLTAEIVRKIDHDGYFEYGLKIKHSGPTVFNHIKSFVKKAQDEHNIQFNR